MKRKATATSRFTTEVKVHFSLLSCNLYGHSHVSHAKANAVQTRAVWFVADTEEGDNYSPPL